jgi:hypothetical protein
MLPPDDSTRATLRHLLATLAYRSAKVLRDVPADFPQATFGDATRTPVGILGHMGDLLDWSISFTRGQGAWVPGASADWDVEVERWTTRLATLDTQLQQPLADGAAERLIQGPLADALTHVGQLAMLRGRYGAPIRTESYARAAIAAGQVGLEQPPPGREFDGDASAR